jgi:hypothetical protein
MNKYVLHPVGVWQGGWPGWTAWRACISIALAFHCKGEWTSRIAVLKRLSFLLFMLILVCLFFLPTRCSCSPVRLDRLPNPTSLLKWCMSNQGSGYRGRPNKPEDSCYSFWIGASLAMLGQHLGLDIGSDWTKRAENRQFNLRCQHKIGGFSKEPGPYYPDLLHAYMAVCGLSLIGMDEQLQAIDVVLGLTKKVRTQNQERWCCEPVRASLRLVSVVVVVLTSAALFACLCALHVFVFSPLVQTAASWMAAAGDRMRSRLPTCDDDLSALRVCGRLERERSRFGAFNPVSRSSFRNCIFTFPQSIFMIRGRHACTRN